MTRVLAGQDECNKPEDKIDPYCQKKAKGLNNKKAFDRATERYVVQEETYNQLATCYTDMMNLDVQVRLANF